MTSKLESSSYYQFSKVLSSQQYGVGKLVADFIAKYNEDYQDKIESAKMIPQPLEFIKRNIEETVEALFTHFNLSNSSSHKQMQFCRPAVERFFYSKLLKHLLELYAIKFQNLNNLFQTKRNHLQTKTPQELMLSLEVRYM